MLILIIGYNSSLTMLRSLSDSIYLKHVTTNRVYIWPGEVS